MNKGYIYITGFIGTIVDDDGTITKGVELIDVIQQVQAQPNAESFDVTINSPGGYVDIGFDIYDYIRSLQKPIKTIGVDVVASIATVIFMSGDERILSPKCEFMIHLPTGSIQGTAEEIKNYSDLVLQCEKRLLDFYKKTTNLSDEALKPLLKRETFLTSQEAFDLKFSTSLEAEQTVVAYLNSKSNKMNYLTKEEAEKRFKKSETLLEKILNKISGKGKGGEPKALMVKDANDGEIDFPDLVEGDTPKAGDKATIDGKDADGEIVMPSGETFVFKAGVLEEIKPADEDTEALKEELENLKAENEELTNELTEVKSDLKEAITALKTVQSDLKNIKKTVGSTFNYRSEKERKEKEAEDKPAKRSLFKEEEK
jgi:ATP-dependent Clp protease protease subunit